MKKLLILFFICLLASCGKERSIRIKAINAATGQPYAGLEYRIAFSKTTGSGEKYRTEASGVLDGNGEAVVNIKQKKGRTYSVRVVEPENTCYNKMITQYFDSPYDVDGTFTFEFAPCAYLKFRYHNISCQGTSDHIEVTRVTNLSGYVGFYNPATYDGCTDYTMQDFVQVPMGYWYFTWEVTKNNVTNSFSDTIFLTAGEYKYYEFNY